MRSNRSETSGAGHTNLQALAVQRVVRTIVIPPLSADGAIALDLSVNHFEHATRRFLGKINRGGIAPQLYPLVWGAAAPVRCGRCVLPPCARSPITRIA